MPMTDPIADLLTRIRNAHISKHDRLNAPASKVKLALCKVLEEQGYIRGFRVHEEPPAKFVEIILRYDHQGTPAITKIERVSKPVAASTVASTTSSPFLTVLVSPSFPLLRVS